MTETVGTCIGSRVTGQTRAALELFQHYQAGYLPEPGGVLEQPAWLLDSFRVIAANLEDD